MFHIVIAGIDYSTASLEEREMFSLTKAKQEAFYEYLMQLDVVQGAVIISTCNRMELCLSLKAEIEPFILICNFLNLEYKKYEGMRKTYHQKAAIDHLCLLACGAKSQIFGEDQIISQIKSSIAMAREGSASDPILEVLFRTAIACAKKIRASINLTKRETSIADRVIDKMKQEEMQIRKVLVIGNGEMGQYMVKKLLQHQLEVTMSVRQYKHRMVVVQAGCETIDFDEIYHKMEEVDAIVSATLSPHHTIKLPVFQKLSKQPKYLFDLAVPRDIDPEIAKLEGVKIYDVDCLSQSSNQEKHKEELEQMKVIIDKYRMDFYKWYEFKQNLLGYGEEHEA